MNNDEFYFIGTNNRTPEQESLLYNSKYSDTGINFETTARYY